MSQVGRKLNGALRIGDKINKKTLAGSVWERIGSMTNWSGYGKEVIT